MIGPGVLKSLYRLIGRTSVIYLTGRLVTHLTQLINLGVRRSSQEFIQINQETTGDSFSRQIGKVLPSHSTDWLRSSQKFVQINQKIIDNLIDRSTNYLTYLMGVGVCRNLQKITGRVSVIRVINCVADLDDRLSY